MTKITGT